MTTKTPLRWKSILINTAAIGIPLSVVLTWPNMIIQGIRFSMVASMVAIAMVISGHILAYLLTKVSGKFHFGKLLETQFASDAEVALKLSQPQEYCLIALQALSLPGMAFVEEWIFRYHNDTFAESFWIGCVMFALPHYFLANYNILSTIITLIHGGILGVVYHYGGLELAFSTHLTVNILSHITDWIIHLLGLDEDTVMVFRFLKKKKMRRGKKFAKWKRPYAYHSKDGGRDE